MDLAEKLLVLADAATDDGGQALVRALRTVLAEVAPFDAGEAVLADDGRLLRWRLDDGPAGELLGADLVRHIGALHAPLRLDDLDDVSPFPETRSAMEALGLRSLLVLPFQGGGALAVARRYGWAFVGASLHHLWPVRGMAGIGLRQAVLLARLGQRVEALEGELERATATPDELRTRLERAEAGRAEADEKLGRAEGERRALAVEVEALRRESESAQGREQSSERERSTLRAALGEQESRVRDFEARVAELEKGLAEATRARDEARGEVERTRRAAEDAGRASGESREDATRARMELEQAKKGAEEEHVQVASLSAERDELRRDAEGLRARLATEIPALEADNRVLRSELQASRDEAARHLRAAQRAEARLSALEERDPDKPASPRPRPGPKRPRSGR